MAAIALFFRVVGLLIWQLVPQPQAEAVRPLITATQTTKHHIHVIFGKSKHKPVQIQGMRTLTLPLNKKSAKEFITIFNYYMEILNINFKYL
jgi:hypothetical protein